jgi:hypothetical protein
VLILRDARLSPIQLLFLLAMVVGLRLPSLDTAFLPQDQSVYIAVAMRAADGATLYADNWDHKPPLLLWLFEGLYTLFGAYTQHAAAVLTMVVLFLAAIFTAALSNRFRNTSRGAIWAPLLLIVLASEPWYTQELNAEVLLLLPLLWLFKLLADHAIEESGDWQSLLWAGVLSGLVFWTKYQLLLIAGAGILGFLLLSPFRLRTLFTLLAGFLLTSLVVLMVLHLRGNLEAWWRLGVLFNADYWLMGRNPGDADGWWGALEYLKIWGVPLLVGLVSFLRLRSVYFGLAIRERRQETLMAFWLLGGLLSIVQGGQRMYLHYFLVLLPPLIFYIIWLMQGGLPRFLTLPILLLTLVMPTFTHATYYAVRVPALYTKVAPLARPQGWLHSLHHGLQDPCPQLRTHLQAKQVQRIWVAAFEPQWYLRLGYAPATPYVNFNMARVRMHWLPENVRNTRPLSGEETLPNVHDAFEKDPPDVVLDPQGYFAEMRSRIYWLQRHYVPDTVCHMPIWWHRVPSE